MKFFCNISVDLVFSHLQTHAVLYSYLDPHGLHNVHHKNLRHSLIINNFFIENHVKICDNELLHFKNLLSLDFVGKTIQVL